MSRRPYRSPVAPLLALCVGASLLLPSLALAQEEGGEQRQEEEILLVPPAPRQGYWLSASAANAVNFNSSTDDGDIGPINGPVFQARLGEMVTDWLGFGLQFGGGFGSGSGWENGWGGLMMDLQLVYPAIPHLALHLNLGAGGLSLTEQNVVQEDLKGTGGAYYGVGLSWDWFPFYDSGSGGLAVVPTVQLHYMPGDLTEAIFIITGVEFTWWTGLDRDKLELPFDERYKKVED